MSVHGTFHYIFYNKIDLCARFCCIRLFDPKFKVNIKTFLILGFCVSVFLLELYTIYAYDLETKMRCMVMVGMSLQVSLFFLNIAKENNLFKISEGRL